MQRISFVFFVLVPNKQFLAAHLLVSLLTIDTGTIYEKIHDLSVPVGSSRLGQGAPGTPQSSSVNPTVANLCTSTIEYQYS